MPILYTDDRIIDMVRDVLDSWSHEFGDGPIFKVYSLQYMLRVLKNTCVGANCWFSDTPAISTVEKDMYCFTPGICCDVRQHFVQGNPIHTYYISSSTIQLTQCNIAVDHLS